MSPRGPKEKIMAMAVVKGGEISGSTMARSRNAAQRFERLARTAVNAKKKPSTVPAAPTRLPSSRLFQKAL
jgi:hypothetical protein